MRRATLVGAALLLVAVASALFYRPALRHGFSAREKPWAVETWVARHLRSLATGTDTRSMVNPIPSNPIALAEGRDHFADHCAICHANDGSGRTAINAGLYPPAPDLREAHTQELSDGEIFRIIENGIRFTGMPGWGKNDEENWKLVLFIRHLPDLTEEELGFMREIHPDNEEAH